MSISKKRGVRQRHPIGRSRNELASESVWPPYPERLLLERVGALKWCARHRSKAVSFVRLKASIVVSVTFRSDEVVTHKFAENAGSWR